LIRVRLMAEYEIRRVLCPRCGHDWINSCWTWGGLGRWRFLWFRCLGCLHYFKAEEVKALG